MTLNEIRIVLGWCLVINVGLMIFSFLVLAGARAWVCKMQSRLFPITEGQFNAIIYSSFAFHKILIIMFNIVPYLAVSIMTG